MRFVRLLLGPSRASCSPMLLTTTMQLSRAGASGLQTLSGWHCQFNYWYVAFESPCRPPCRPGRQSLAAYDEFHTRRVHCGLAGFSGGRTPTLSRTSRSRTRNLPRPSPPQRQRSMSTSARTARPSRRPSSATNRAPAVGSASSRSGTRPPSTPPWPRETST